MTPCFVEIRGGAHPGPAGADDHDINLLHYGLAHQWLRVRIGIEVDVQIPQRLVVPLTTSEPLGHLLLIATLNLVTGQLGITAFGHLRAPSLETASLLGFCYQAA